MSSAITEDAIAAATAAVLAAAAANALAATTASASSTAAASGSSSSAQTPAPASSASLSDFPFATAAAATASMPSSSLSASGSGTGPGTGTGMGSGSAAVHGFCLCQSPAIPTEGRPTVTCDNCSVGCHADCVNLSQEVVRIVESYVCPLCRAGVGSKYCTAACGISVAARAIRRVLPPTQAQWNQQSHVTFAVAAATDDDERVLQQLEETMELRKQEVLAINQTMRDLMLHLARIPNLKPESPAESTPVKREREDGGSDHDDDASDGDDDDDDGKHATKKRRVDGAGDLGEVDCFSCGSSLTGLSIVKHLESCFAKVSQRVPTMGWVAGDAAENDVFCNYQESVDSYCRNLAIFCTQHNRKMKRKNIIRQYTNKDVCGHLETNGSCCMLKRGDCKLHVGWEKIRVAELKVEAMVKIQQFGKAMMLATDAKRRLSSRECGAALSLHSTTRHS
ncbi:hypothetical protein CAOG_06743 [Capsaspora owczarzaki ATCC 30864]|uniref:hypothetical protein n=1 Tax=Capsaspora owczarzaki (strain ATCC 30864) TaxID=595528 RepID=UPI000352332C|nr:hypothetical protein CAOG_06743 [Capsaspora owczarzaki ATCC 30864]|eukprot:XP_004344364.2 hypothetical protein CAOG_06743 [Capsaspora owczarzaki ATCC 30864]